MNFTVLIPVYHANNPDHLELALKSVTDQTVKPDEILLVEDGPIPPVLDNVINEFSIQAEGRVKRIRVPENRGLVNSLNVGLEHASYELVARMDTDDLSAPHRFEKQLAFFKQHPDYSLVGGQIQEFIEEIGDVPLVRKLPLKYEEIVAYSKKRCPFNHPSVMYRKSMLQAIGGYEEYRNFEDYYLWAKIIHAGYKVANLPDVLLYFRMGQDFVKRRKGITYFFREYALLKGMRRISFLNNRQFAHNILRRLPLRIMPDFIVKWVYWYFLRG
jgi:glycosyltransferase involved in cell wall biosynthesis